METPLQPARELCKAFWLWRWDPVRFLMSVFDEKPVYTHNALKRKDQISFTMQSHIHQVDYINKFCDLNHMSKPKLGLLHFNSSCHLANCWSSVFREGPVQLRHSYCCPAEWINKWQCYFLNSDSTPHIVPTKKVIPHF